MRLALALLACLGAALPAYGESESAEAAKVAAFTRLVRPAPADHLTYGPALTQCIDVYLPKGSGPFPVAVMIHGGCWSNLAPGREQLRHMAADLAAHGVAVWNIGYRRANDEGGGYPGTFQDVATAIDRLRAEAPRYHLDLRRLVVIGHSAGGHLALWAAARANIPNTSAVFAPHPLLPHTVISLAGVPDLKAARIAAPDFCGPGLFATLTGARGPLRPDVYADTSPIEMLPVRARGDGKRRAGRGRRARSRSGLHRRRPRAAREGRTDRGARCRPSRLCSARHRCLHAGHAPDRVSVGRPALS